ncbi:MAG: Ni/Fe hydrogenase subunit alpha [Polyangia bacterium]|jgi:F420-non-reducing hydrogenase large subunit
MSRKLTIDPVTRIEGHAKVHIDIDDDGKVSAATLHVLEFRGFERFLQGMQAELMPTITTRICGTCPHAHHLVAAKCLDTMFSAPPPKTALLLRQILNCGSMIHSHAIHFFALAGPDLFLGQTSPVAKRNLVGLLEAAPDLTKKALRLRSIGQIMVEIVGGRGTHPVTAVAGGMASGLSHDSLTNLRALAAEALELAKAVLAAGVQALRRDETLLARFPLVTSDMGTVQGDALDLYDGKLRVRQPDGKIGLELAAADYAAHMVEEALPHSYGKQILLKGPGGAREPYRVGPLARLNCAETTGTPLADAALAEFRQVCGHPSHHMMAAHWARLVELLHCAEKAGLLLADEAISSPEIRSKPGTLKRRAIAHVEAPRGVLIHDYQVDGNALIETANFLVATQHNLASINSTIKDAAAKLVDKSDAELLDGVELAIRCYDPCLSCSTHRVGQMPLRVDCWQGGKPMRSATR